MTHFHDVHQAIIDSVPLAAGSSIAEETIAYEHEGHALEGYLAYDESPDGPRPTVLIVHDWTGLREYPKARAQMLARLGYVAFAIDVYGSGIRFGDGDLPGDGAAAEAGKYYGDLALLRARVQAGYDRAVVDPRVDPDRIVVVGYCFGGSATLEFARTGATLRGAVSFHGALVTHEPADVAAIAAPLLVLTGAADDVVPDEKVLAFENELRTRPELDWQLTSYSGAPHAFTLPALANYRPVADARSWRELVGFLDEVMG
jgi:dienelactone hydrolase